MIRVTFADGATEDREDDSDCYPDAHANFVSTLHINRGADVRVKVGVDEWRLCYVETCEEQIARLEGERDEAHQKYVLRDAHALLWKGWAREFWEEKREAWRTLRSLRDAARSACDREMGEGHRYPENVKVSTLVAHLNTMDFGHAEKARADAAEKRLADVRAWASGVVERGLAEAPKHPGNAEATWTIVSILETVVARIDGIDGESK